MRELCKNNLIFWNYLGIMGNHLYPKQGGKIEVLNIATLCRKGKKDTLD